MFSVRRLVLASLLSLAAFWQTPARALDLDEMPPELRELAADMMHAVVEDVPSPEVEKLFAKHRETLRALIVDNKYEKLLEGESSLFREVIKEQVQQTLKSLVAKAKAPTPQSLAHLIPDETEAMMAVLNSRLKTWRPTSLKEVAIEMIHIARWSFEQSLLNLYRGASKGAVDVHENLRGVAAFVDQNLPPDARRALTKAGVHAIRQTRELMAKVTRSAASYVLSDEKRFLASLRWVSELRGTQGTVGLLREGAHGVLDRFEISKTPEFKRTVDAFEMPDERTRVFVHEVAPPFFDKMPASQKARLANGLLKLPAGATPAEKFEALVMHAPTVVQKVTQMLLKLAKDETFAPGLKRVLDNLPAHLGEADVLKLLEAQYPNFHDVVASIDLKPRSVGTIGQVHSAVLKNGTKALFKVQKPGLRKEFLEDLTRILALVPAKHRPAFRDQFEMFLDETSFWKEGRNLAIARMKLHDPEGAGIVVPKLITQFRPSEGVLVMEDLGGESLAKRIDDADFEGTWSRVFKHNTDNAVFQGKPVELSRADRAYFDWVEEVYGPAEFAEMKREAMSFFHADLHPGNVLAIEGRTAKGLRKLGFIDFGNAGHLVVDEARGIDERKGFIKIMSTVHMPYDSTRPFRLPAKTQAALGYFVSKDRKDAKGQFRILEQDDFYKDLQATFADPALNVEGRYGRILEASAEHGATYSKGFGQFNKTTFTAASYLSGPVRDHTMYDIGVNSAMKLFVGESVLDFQDLKDAGEIQLQKFFGVQPGKPKAKNCWDAIFGK